MELGHIEYFEIRLNVYEYILDKGFIEGGFMPYEVWLPGLTYREKIVNYNSLKVFAYLEKEWNFMHIDCKNLLVKAAFDILDSNAVQMTFVNLLWFIWKCSYFT